MEVPISKRLNVKVGDLFVVVKVREDRIDPASYRHVRTMEISRTNRPVNTLLSALKDIIAECPNPKLPYGIRIVEIAQAAIEQAEGRDK